MTARLLSLAAMVALAATLGAADKPEPVARVLFDFEDPADLKAWANLELPDAKEPPAKLELSTDHATAGKQSLKITFAGGTWPTLTTTQIPDDWAPYETFHADVTVSKSCLIGFQVLQEKSSRAGGWDGSVSRWAKTELLRPGTTHVSAPLHPNGWSAIRAKLENGKELGKVVRFEIFVYRPAEGETIYVDNVRVTSVKEPTPAASKTEFAVLGTDLTVKNVQELGKKLADKWSKPEDQTVDQVEAAFRDRFTALKKEHPKAVFAVFRDGEKGFDPSNPDKEYAGWKDAYWSSHGPDGATVDRARNEGKNATQEIFMRHRSPLMRVDLASLPAGANVLAAQLVVVRARDQLKEHDPYKQPTMWVAEACTRPWEEYEVNAFEYARGKFWREVGGMYYGEDPDFLPVYLAHGPGRGKVNTWEFTEAVKFWADGKHANHGFMLHGDGKDYLTAWTREAPEVKNRPALLVVYEPK